MTRRELREHCFKLLFGADFYPEGEQDVQLENYFLSPPEDEDTPEGKQEILHNVELGEENSREVKERARAMIRLIPELDSHINCVAEGWKTKRIGKAELAILRLAIYEMKYDEEVPEKVAINEAVELAKRFGGKDSSAFINGILAKLV